MTRKLASTTEIGTERDYARNSVFGAMRRCGSLRWAPSIQGLVMLLGLISAGWGYLIARVASAPTYGRIARAVGERP
jgi:hypothetical protein